MESSAASMAGVCFVAGEVLSGLWVTFDPMLLQERVAIVSRVMDYNTRSLTFIFSFILLIVI